MKTKHRKTIPKTRGHRVEKKQNVHLRKHTSPKQHDKRETNDEDQHGQDSKREGNKDGCPGGEREDTKKHTQVEQSGNSENSEESVHPGLIQTLPDMLEQSAVHETSDKTEIEAEEIPLWS
jgi:hypothetical protein